jgi:hypothetical protein
MANEATSTEADAEHLANLEVKAQTGDTEAQLEAASLLLDKCKLQTPDQSEAVRAVAWLRKAADQGNHRAQSRLGNCYMNGKGVDQDFTQAIQWYKKAAWQGNNAAQFLLGQCYESGNGVVQDFAEAARWYQMMGEDGEDLLETLYAEHKSLPLPMRDSKGKTDTEYIKTLTPTERHRLAIARYEEAVMGKKGEAAKTLEFFRKTDDFIREHPGVTAEDPDFKTFLDGDPPKTEQKWREIKRQIVADKTADLESCKLSPNDKEYIKKGLNLNQQYFLILAAHAWRKWGKESEFIKVLEYFRKVDKSIAENPNLTPEDSAFKQFLHENKPKWNNQFLRKTETGVFDDAAFKQRVKDRFAIGRKIEDGAVANPIPPLQISKSGQAVDSQQAAAEPSPAQPTITQHQPRRNTATISTPDANAEDKKKFTLVRCVKFPRDGGRGRKRFMGVSFS